MASLSGLVKLGALERLPGDRVQVDAAGYPGARFHRGVFVSPDSFHAFTAAAGMKDVPDVDWSREVVAFVVLDAQTNKLHVAGLRAKGGEVTLSIDWIGIEPFYPQHTPYALAVIHLGKAEKLAFELVSDGRHALDLGSLAVSSE